MQYHINKKGEVKQCRAKINCPYANDPELGKHFPTRTAAEEHLQKRLKKKFPTPTLSRRARVVASLPSTRGLHERGIEINVSSTLNPKATKATASSVDILSNENDEALLSKIRSRQIKPQMI